MKVEFCRHNLEESDIQRACDCMRSVILTTGPYAKQFEESFAGYAGQKHVVTLNSCTGALHLALLALDLKPGDEVITTAMTFIATATAIMHTGAVPVLVDVEADTGLIDPRLVERAVTKRTRAIMPVHLYGALADMRALRAIADRHGLAIVEDAAHCIEGERDGVRPGQLGEAVCYSFYATKNLTCGEGGALGTNDERLAARVKMLRTHGMSKEAADRYTKRYQHWDMLAEGWKYNLADVLAALLVGQLERLPANLERRQAICRRYDEAFAHVPGLDVPRAPGVSARHLYTIWVPAERRDQILHQLQEEGVGVAVNYRAIHTLTFFRERFGFAPDDFPNARRMGDRTLTLPLYPKLRDDEVDYVAETVARVVGA